VLLLSKSRRSSRCCEDGMKARRGLEGEQRARTGRFEANVVGSCLMRASEGVRAPSGRAGGVGGENGRWLIEEERPNLFLLLPSLFTRFNCFKLLQRHSIMQPAPTPPSTGISPPIPQDCQTGVLGFFHTLERLKVRFPFPLN
jgi:hypothetical protein